jgi:hypothetical protein
VTSTTMSLSMQLSMVGFGHRQEMVSVGTELSSAEMMEVDSVSKRTNGSNPLCSMGGGPSPLTVDTNFIHTVAVTSFHAGPQDAVCHPSRNFSSSPVTLTKPANLRTSQLAWVWWEQVQTGAMPKGLGWSGPLKHRAWSEFGPGRHEYDNQVSRVVIVASDSRSAEESPLDRGE